MRPDVMGLRLHPYLMPVALAFPLVLMSRIAEFPARMLAALLVFTGMYCFSMLQRRQPRRRRSIQDRSRLSRSSPARCWCARGDFVAGALGSEHRHRAVGVARLARRRQAGVEAMEGGQQELVLAVRPAGHSDGRLHLPADADRADAHQGASCR